MPQSFFTTVVVVLLLLQCCSCISLDELLDLLQSNAQQGDAIEEREPTDVPTDVPGTDEPTDAPTLSIDSDAPTPALTQEPTLVPTNIPTSAPTVVREPTDVPTDVPGTDEPTDAPTLSIDSDAPTPALTQEPTLVPTNIPTSAPTVAPTSTDERTNELTASRNYPSFGGCGRVDLNASYHYGLINERMQREMAIRFTTSSEFNFLAGMIPHNAAAMDMCSVYLHEVETNEQVPANEGIASLCYNITYGPISWGKWQYDFSQPGETAQMLDALDYIGMMGEYTSGCPDIAHEQTTQDGGGHDDEIFMGCGRLDLPEAKDYMAKNMKMLGYMAVNFTADAAVDFLLGMIPRHEGAIEMCNIYYRYWGCAPSRVPCWDAHPLQGIPADWLTWGETRNLLKVMKHICTDHIMETRPKEVMWMKEELRRLSPESLAQYEDMQRTGEFPCRTAL